jgi:hypothetical protein
LRSFTATCVHVLFVNPLRSRTLCDLIDAPSVHTLQRTLRAHAYETLRHSSCVMETHSRAKVKHFLGRAAPRRRASRHALRVMRAHATAGTPAKYARCVDITCEMRVSHHA